MSDADRWERLVGVVRASGAKVTLLTTRDFPPGRTLGPLTVRHDYDCKFTFRMDDSATLRYLRLDKNGRWR